MSRTAGQEEEQQQAQSDCRAKTAHDAQLEAIVGNTDLGSKIDRPRATESVVIGGNLVLLRGADGGRVATGGRRFSLGG